MTSNAPLDITQIEEKIRRELNNLFESVEEYESRLLDAAQKNAHFKQMYYHTFLNGNGSVKDREAEAEWACREARLDADIADGLVKACRERMHAQRLALEALRTLNSNVRTSIGL
jgi:hypothetical protein